MPSRSVFGCAWSPGQRLEPQKLPAKNALHAELLQSLKIFRRDSGPHCMAKEGGNLAQINVLRSGT